MKKKRLGSGFEMPILGIGTYTLGGEHDPDYSRDKDCIEAIKNALDIGFTHIDTAEVYGGGHTEELVAKAIQGRDRKKLFITSKVFHTHFKHDDVINSAKDSLRRLNIDYIDLYLLHSFNPNIPLKETMAAMNELVQKGLVKQIGVCNFSIDQLKEAQKCSKAKIAVNQMKYCLWTKAKPDIETFEYCQENDILITAYKIFGRGKIITDKIPLLSELAKKYNKTDAQIMINWIVSKINFTAIFTSMDKKHFKENIGALDFQLSDKDICKLDRTLLTK